MSSHIPSNETFFAVLSFLNDYSEKSDYSLVGTDLIGAGNKNINELFIEKLLNLTIKSVNKQYKNPVEPSTEIYTPAFMPIEIKFITKEVCLKQLEYIDYQIENSEIDLETFSKLQSLQLYLVKEINKKALYDNKAYQSAPWGVNFIQEDSTVS